VTVVGPEGETSASETVSIDDPDDEMLVVVLGGGNSTRQSPSAWVTASAIPGPRERTGDHRAERLLLTRRRDSCGGDDETLPPPSPV